MAKGIIVVKSSGAGSTSTGMIRVTDGTPTSSVGSVDSGTSTVGSTDSVVVVGVAPTPAEIGSTVSFTQSTNSNVGDLVDFSIGADGNAAGISTLTAGRVITGEHRGDHTVAAGESVVLLNAHIGGNVKVEGGILTITGTSHMEKNVGSLVANSYIFIDGRVHIEKNVEMKAAGYLIVNGAEVEGNVNSDGSIFTSVSNCRIKGGLQIINAVSCKSSANNVSGRTNTTGCTPA